MRFDLSDILYAETVLKHSMRLIPQGAAAWSASPNNRLRSIVEEKVTGWNEKQGKDVSKGTHAAECCRLMS